jgi:hypothetical protein
MASQHARRRWIVWFRRPRGLDAPAVFVVSRFIYTQAMKANCRSIPGRRRSAGTWCRYCCPRAKNLIYTLRNIGLKIKLPALMYPVVES